MIARIFALITFGISLGALYLFYDHRVPVPLPQLKASGIIASYLYTPEELLYIDIHDEGTIYLYQQDGPPTVRVEADTALLPFIDIQCKEKRVTIHLRKSDSLPKELPLPLYYIVAPDIASLTLHGNAKLEAREGIKVDSLDINIRGNGNIIAIIDTKELDIQCHGNSELHLSGTAHEQYLDLHGSSRYNAQDLTSEECSIRSSGGAIAYLGITKTIKGILSGSSKVNFFGNPEFFVTKNDLSELKKSSTNSPLDQNLE